MRLALLLVAAAVLLAGCASSDNPTPATGTPSTSTPTSSSSGAHPGVCVSTKGNSSAANPTWVLTTSLGTIRATLFCAKAPLTTQSIVNYTEAGLYDGTKYHRVIQGFMDQGGDPLTKDDSKVSEWGTGGPPSADKCAPVEGKNDCASIAEEFYCADGTIVYEHMPNPCPNGLGLKHADAGTFSMARTNAPHSTGSQFFMTAAAQPSLDGSYSVFGHTADSASTQVVLTINRVPTDANDRPTTPVVLQSATIEWG